MYFISSYPSIKRFFIIYLPQFDLIVFMNLLTSTNTARHSRDRHRKPHQGRPGTRRWSSESQGTGIEGMHRLHRLSAWLLGQTAENWLVVFSHPSEKYDFVNDGMIIETQYSHGTIQKMATKPPTSFRFGELWAGLSNWQSLNTTVRFLWVQKWLPRFSQFQRGIGMALNHPCFFHSTNIWISLTFLGGKSSNSLVNHKLIYYNAHWWYTFPTHPHHSAIICPLCQEKNRNQKHINNQFNQSGSSVCKESLTWNKFNKQNTVKIYWTSYPTSPARSWPNFSTGKWARRWCPILS